MSSNQGTGICYVIDGERLSDDCRLCLRNNETTAGDPWYEISPEEYSSRSVDGFGCREYHRCCEGGAAFWDTELSIAKFVSGVLLFLVMEGTRWKKRRGLHDRFRTEGIRIRATVTERLSDPVVVGGGGGISSHRNRDSETGGGDLQHSYYYRDATRALEFTNTRGETVVRKLPSGALLRYNYKNDNEATSRTGAANNNNEEPVIDHLEHPPIYHLPDHPESALDLDPERLQSENCGRLSLDLSVLVIGLVVSGYLIGIAYVPVWWGVLRQVLFQICAVPLTVGLGYLSGKKLYEAYENDVLRNTDNRREPPNPANGRRKIVWGTAAARQTADANDHGNAGGGVPGGTTITTNNNNNSSSRRFDPSARVPDTYYEQRHEPPPPNGTVGPTAAAACLTEYSTLGSSVL